MKELNNLAEVKARLEKELFGVKQATNQALTYMNEEFMKSDKAKREKLVFQLPELTSYHIELIHDAGFMTGSSVFTDNVPNDMDYVVNLPTTCFYGYSLGYESYYDDMNVLFAHKDGIIFNILCVDMETYNVWKKTTEVMQMLFENNAYDIRSRFKHKWARVMLFRAFKDIFRPACTAASDLDLNYAHEHKLCVLCHREARVFIDGSHEALYKADGTCDRCRTELGLGQQVGEATGY